MTRLALRADLRGCRLGHPKAATLRQSYAGLPARLAAEGVAPSIPWLFGFKLDFRFR